MIGVGAKRIHGQFARRRKSLAAKPGSALEWVIIKRMTPRPAALDQSNDVTPQTTTDTAVSISIAEYGDVLSLSGMMEAESYTDSHKAAAETVANNFTDTTEIIIRNAFIAGTNIYRPLNVARTALGSAVTSHPLTYNHLTQIAARCRSLNMPGWGTDDQYAALIPSQLVPALQNDTQWLALAEYNGGKGAYGNVFAGEVGQLAGFRFSASPWGKVYWGGGLVAGASTTLNGAVTAGDTSIVVSNASSIAVGDELRIGLVETADTETVLVSSIDSTTIGVMGAGSDDTNMGLHYSHATGAVVIECQSVGSMLVIGDRSVGMYYSPKTGPDSSIKVTVPSTRLPDRFTDFSWRLIAGWGVIAQKYLLRAEFPLPHATFGYMEPES
jgi:N4-gp56 family major capsid protein